MLSLEREKMDLMVLQLTIAKYTKKLISPHMPKKAHEPACSQLSK
ncbi:hypothetical protein SALWKB29_0500 [Snodgrassella communis]|uniref:Uncharacterized protein n=1 Tax=Snodgrassella communis TaxID=2946699 RepID=A0A836MQP6_9NEIS|nr:hypothetical protein SALWKB29_0500 [Snodgrassella communis]